MGRQKAVYRIQEFATRTGVTVRTLHHYDRLGLLTPTGRSKAGYRLYGEPDAARLEPIVVLKHLGLSLDDELVRDVRAAIAPNDSPSSPAGQALAGQMRAFFLQAMQQAS